MDINQYQTNIQYVSTTESVSRNNVRFQHRNKYQALETIPGPICNSNKGRRKNYDKNQYQAPKPGPGTMQEPVLKQINSTKIMQVKKKELHKSLQIEMVPGTGQNQDLEPSCECSSGLENMDIKHSVGLKTTGCRWYCRVLKCVTNLCVK